jgi:two-component system OmpR family response regulator
MRILIVEDEVSMARSLARGLAEEGYTADVAFDGEEGLARATTEAYDAIILDLMLPKLNGYAITAALRERGARVPVLMLTAKQGEFDQTEALDTGADDFLSKPFSYPVQGAVLAHGNVRLDTREHRCWRDGEEVPLTAREFALLAYLLHRSGEPVSKAELLKHVWDPIDERDGNVVEVYIGYLRRKLDRPGEPSHIDTVRSAGYRLAGPGPAAAATDG